MAFEVSSRAKETFSDEQQFRVCLGSLTGLSGTIAGLPAPGRVLIKLQRGVYLEIDQSFLEPVIAE